jgi:hypothetical protein
LENLKGRDHLGDLGVDGKIILKRILGKQDVRMWTAFIWLKMDPLAGCWEYGNKYSSYIKRGEFLD